MDEKVRDVLEEVAEVVVGDVLPPDFPVTPLRHMAQALLELDARLAALEEHASV